MVKPIKIIYHQGFSEWVYIIVFGVYLPHLHNFVDNIIPNKMVAKRHSFNVQGATRISCVQHHTCVIHKYRYTFGYLDPHWS